LLYEDPANKAQSKEMVEFLKWALADGQKFASELGYAPLPSQVITMELAALEKVKTQ
jgi:phosphate transport system substrate-binding protein